MLRLGRYFCNSQFETVAESERKFTFGYSDVFPAGSWMEINIGTGKLI